MRLTVVTAVLLLVGALNTVTADIDCPAILDMCQDVPHMPCGDGWIRFDENRCVKYVRTAKTFQDAQDECRRSDGDLISIHNAKQAVHMLCLTGYHTAPSDPQTAWIGVKRSGENFAFTDGSEFNCNAWNFGEPDNVGGEEDCVEIDFKVMGMWNDVPCSKKNYFVCSKNSKGVLLDHVKLAKIQKWKKLQWQKLPLQQLIF